MLLFFSWILLLNQYSASFLFYVRVGYTFTTCFSRDGNASGEDGVGDWTLDNSKILPFLLVLLL